MRTSRFQRSTRAALARRWIVGFILAGILALLAARHTLRWEGRAWDSTVLFAFTTMALTLVLAHTRRPVVSRERHRRRLVVVIPVHNEDPALLERCLRSLEIQTTLPDKVHLIDDGSSSTDARDLFVRWCRTMKDIIETQLTVQPNKGKRHAQANSFRNDEADIFCTVDSDTILDPRAIEEGLKPFQDSKVEAVAGVVMGVNWNQNVLTRIMDLEFTNSFLIGRAANTALGSVLVTSGALAFYRATTVKESLEMYLSQTFLGVPVVSGDDRSLTQFCLLRGKVVLQDTCIALTAVPEKLSHLIRQRVRWNGSFYRGVIWVLRNMPMSKPAYWITLLKAVSFVTFTMTLLLTIFVAPFLSGTFLWWYLGYVFFLAYLNSLRYLAFRRHDMTLKDQLIIFSLAPILALLHFFILTPVQYYAIARLRQNKWRTRTEVEVTIEAPPQIEASEWIDLGADEMSVEDLTEMFPPESENEMASRYLAHPVAAVPSVKSAA